MTSSGGEWDMFFKQELGRGGGGIISSQNFWGASVLKHYTFLKTTTPHPWDVINDWSLSTWSLTVREE